MKVLGRPAYLGCVEYQLPTLLLMAAFPFGLVAQSKGPEPLSAQESDPVRLGWMQGTPPPADRVVHVADGSFFRFPALRWSVVHMRELMPTVRVSRGSVAPMALPYALDPGIDKVVFKPWHADTTMTWEQSLWANYTDGILVMHRGRVVYERYFGALGPDDVHVVMSLTKSFNGTLAAALVAEGVLDENKPVPFYVPELARSAFGDATVRQLMDMTTGLRYSEDYADPKADVWMFGAAGEPNRTPGDGRGPLGYCAYLETVRKEGQHGAAFHYKTVNADALGWVIARATGKPVDELLAERIWGRIGMEQDGYYQVDALGTPFTGGGFNASLRDLARFGELIRNKGRHQGEQVIPQRAVEDIMAGGSKEAFAKSAYTELRGWSYRDMWWVTGNAHGAFMARGVYGQAIYIDPKAEMVIVRLASHPVAANTANDATSLPAYQAVAEYLMGKH